MSENITHAVPFNEHLISLKQDAVLWKARQLYKADAQPHDKQKGFEEIVTMLCCITKSITREDYINLISKEHKIAKGELRNAISNKLDEAIDKQKSATTVDDDGIMAKLPDWATPERVYNYGLDWQLNAGNRTGYWFSKRGNLLDRLTNFVLTPLFHLKDRNGENRRLAWLHNGMVPDKIIELPSKALNSLERFEEVLLDQGYYMTLEGFAKPNLKRLQAAILNDFHEANELKCLGWQQEGFWSYNNAISPKDGSITMFSETGLAKHNDVYYYSPSCSNIYTTNRKHEDGSQIFDNNIYESDKFLNYQPTNVAFTDWAQLVMRWFGDKGMPLICFAFVSIFKDIIRLNQKTPILYGYGIVQSGKSTWAEALMYLFYNKDYRGLQLDTCTFYAFFNRAERNRNCPHLFNEFDEDKIEEEKFTALKSYWDDEGRDKGSGIKGKTETQKWNCTVVLIGQTLTTKDGASVLSRSISVKFDDPGARTQLEEECLQQFNQWKNNGLNGCLIEILKHRDFFKANFAKTFNEELLKLKESIRQTNDTFKERIAKNYCVLLASGKVMLEAFTGCSLGFTYDQLFDYSKEHIISLSRMISDVDNLAAFWQAVDFLYLKGDVQEGVDFKITETMQVKKKLKDDTTEVTFDKPTKVLYIRLTKIYPYYAQNVRQTTGTKPINQQTLITYFESSKPYIGSDPSTRFKSIGGGSTTPTSAFMFIYSKLGINLEREDTAPQDQRKPEELEAKVHKMPEFISGNDKIVFTVQSHRSHTEPGQLQHIEEVYTKCFSTRVDLKDKLYPGQKITLLGLVKETTSNGYTKRTMDVETITLPGYATSNGAPTAIIFEGNSEPF